MKRCEYFSDRPFERPTDSMAIDTAVNCLREAQRRCDEMHLILKETEADYNDACLKLREASAELIAIVTGKPILRG